MDWKKLLLAAVMGCFTMVLSAQENGEDTALVDSYKSGIQGGGIEMYIQSGSNFLPQHVFNKLLFGGEINHDILENSANRFISGSGRFGLQQEMSFRVFINPKYYISTSNSSNKSNRNYRVLAGGGNKKVDDWGKLISKSERNTSLRVKNLMNYYVEAELGGMISGKMTSDAYKLMFMGNGYYRGKTLNVGSNSIHQYLGESIGFGAVYTVNKFVKGSGDSFCNQLKSYTVNQIAFSVGRLNSFQRLNTEVAKVFTSFLADSISVNGRYQWVRMDAQSSGAMFVMSYQSHHIPNRFHNNYPNERIIMRGYTTRNFSIANLGFFYVKDALVSSRGYIWELNGKGFKPVGEKAVQAVDLQQVEITPSKLQQTNWFNAQLDSKKSVIGNLDQRRTGFLLMPFTVKYDIGNSIGFQYVAAKGYLPRMSMMTVIGIPTYLKRNIRKYFGIDNDEEKMTNITFFNVGFAVGGWDKFDFLAGYKLFTNDVKKGKIYIDLRLTGIEALLAPRIYHGFGLSLVGNYHF